MDRASRSGSPYPETRMSVFGRAWAAAVACTTLISAFGSSAMAQTATLPPLPPSPADEPSASTLPPLPAATPDASVESSSPLPVRRDVPEARESPTEPPDAPPQAPDPWATRPFMVEAHLGVGTPLGILGVAFDFAPVPFLALNLGVGLGVSGPEFAFTPRVRLFRWGRRSHGALYLGAGVSANAYDQPTAIDTIPLDGSQSESADEIAHYHWNMAYWTNLEAGVEIRLRSGTSLRPYFGVSRLLNSDPSATLVDAYSGKPPSSPVEPWSGYIGFAVGYTIGSL
jgi:hypothetical protein